MIALLDLRFILLSGKGGVGRTTVAAALARAAAGRGKRVLIAQTDAVERLGKFFGQPGPIGSTVRTLAPGIDAVNMTPKESLHQYALLVVHYEAVYRALFGNRAVRGFLSAIPGLDAYSMLGKAWWHTTETVAATPGKAQGAAALKYDLVVLDGPASGHTLSMLKIPRAIVGAAPAGPLVKDARSLSELLADATRTALVIVTLPEDLPARETVELAHAARAQLGVSLGPVIVNAMPPARLSDAPVAAVLDRLPETTGDDALDATLRMAGTLRRQRATADGILSDLRRDPALPLVLLPRLPSTDLGPREIDELARALSAAAAVAQQVAQG
jgi:anion-transporting  ArsA/GET3 family ATPase